METLLSQATVFFRNLFSEQEYTSGLLSELSCIYNCQPERSFVLNSDLNSSEQKFPPNGSEAAFKIMFKRQ